MEADKSRDCATGNEGIKWTLDGISVSLSTLWAKGDAVIDAAPPKGVLILRSHQCWLGLPAACCVDFTLLEVSVQTGFRVCPESWVLRLLRKQAACFANSVLACQGRDCVHLHLDSNRLVMSPVSCCYNQLG